MGDGSENIIPHLKVYKILVGLYVISLDIELGPKGHHIFVDGGGLTQLGFTHMRVCCPSPHRTELSVGVLAGLGPIFILFFFIFQNNVFVHQFLFFQNSVSIHHEWLHLF